MTALAAVADVEAVSRPVPAGDIARVNRLLEMVSATVRIYTGQTFATATETVTVYPHDGIVRLPQHPVTAVSVVRQSGRTLASTEYTFTADGYLRPPLLGSLMLAGNGPDLLYDDALYNPTGASISEPYWWSLPLTVTYTHGGTVPDDIVMVVAEVTAERWNSSSVNPHQVAALSKTIAGYAESETFRLRGDSLQAWEPAHKMILDRYRRSGLASLRLTS